MAPAGAAVLTVTMGQLAPSFSFQDHENSGAISILHGAISIAWKASFIRAVSGGHGFVVAEVAGRVHDGGVVMSAAKPTRHQWQRHALISAWRGAPEPPLVDLPARSAADLIGRILKEAGLAERAQLEEVLKAWREIMGEFLYQQTKPDAVVRGVLIVRMMQPAVHHALTMEKPRILQKLRAKLGHVGIKDLRFRHG